MYTVIASVGLLSVLYMLSTRTSVITERNSVIVSAASFCIGLIYTVARYRSWEFDVSEEEIHLQRGVIRHKQTLVPRAHIQYVDLETKLVERIFGLSRIVLYTAGSPHSNLVIPGLDAEVATELRQALSTEEANNE